MSGLSESQVSSRGLLGLPTDLLSRWGLADGDRVAVIDLVDAALVIPGGLEPLRAELWRVLRDGAYEEGLAALPDPDLADQ